MQLNLNPACCDTQQLEDYLNASLDEAVAADVESHLSTCHACRQYLEQTAFSQEEWQRTQSLLRPGDQFPPDLEDRTQAGMASGRYASEDDLFRAALDTLESVETEARELQAAINAVKNGDAPVPLDDAFNALRQKYDLPTDA